MKNEDKAQGEKAQLDANKNIKFNKLNQEIKALWSVEALEPKLLLSADLAPGIQNISGSIDQPGEKDKYELVVTETSRFMFDGVSGDDVTWSLVATNGQTQFTSKAINNADFVTLEKGTYDLSVDGVGDALSKYEFKVIGEEGAKALVLNNETVGEFTSNHNAQLYKFDASAGDRLFFQSNSKDNKGTWTLYDIQGNIVQNSKSLSSDLQAFTLNRTGEYWLSIENNNNPVSSPYSFTLFTEEFQQPKDIKLDITQSVAVKPAGLYEFNFSVEQETLIGVDFFSDLDSKVEWSIQTDTGKKVLKSTADTAVTPLLSGHYKLVVNNKDGFDGDVDFKIVSAIETSSQDAGDFDIAFAENDAFKAQLIQFNVSDDTYFDIFNTDNQLSNITEEFTWAIFDTNYYQAASSVHNNTATTLPAGTYYLWIDSTAEITQETTLKFDQWVPTTTDLGTQDSSAAIAINHSFSTPSETRVFNFTLDDSATWLFETSADTVEDTFTVSLVGDDGVVFDNILASTLLQNLEQRMYLKSGNYQLTIKNTNHSENTVAFNIQPLIDIKATALVSGEQINLENMNVGDRVVYTVSADVNKQFILQADQPLADYSIEVFDQFNARKYVDNNIYVSETGNPTLNNTVKYYFSSEGAQGDLYVLLTKNADTNSDTPTTFTLSETVVDYNKGDIVDAQLNQKVAVTFDELEQTKYQFELTDTAPIYLNYISKGAGRVTLKGPSGTVNKYIGGYQNDLVNLLQGATAGTYVLEIDSYSNDFEFEIITNYDRLERISLDTELTLEEGVTSYTMAVEAGKKYTLEHNGRLHYWDSGVKIYNDEGDLLLESRLSQLVEFVADTTSDTYVIEIAYASYEDQLNDAATFTVVEKAQLVTVTRDLGEMAVDSNIIIEQEIASNVQAAQIDFSISNDGTWFIDDTNNYSDSWQIVSNSGDVVASNEYQQRMLDLLAGSYTLQIMRSDSGYSEQFNINLLATSLATNVLLNEEITLNQANTEKTLYVLNNLEAGLYDFVTKDASTLNITSNNTLSYPGGFNQIKSGEIVYFVVDVFSPNMQPFAFDENIPEIELPEMEKSLVFSVVKNTDFVVVKEYSDDVVAAPITLTHDKAVADKYTLHGFSVATEEGLYFVDVLSNSTGNTISIDTATDSQQGFIQNIKPNGFSYVSSPSGLQPAPISFFEPLLGTGKSVNVGFAFDTEEAVTIQLVSSKDALSVDITQPLDITLDTDKNLGLYTFDVTEDTQFAIAELETSGANNVYSLYDENGNNIFAKQTLVGESEGVIDLYAGSYTLAVHKDYSTSGFGDGKLHLSFNAITQTKQNIGTLPTNTAQTSKIITADNEKVAVQFTVAEDGFWTIGLTSEQQTTIYLEGGLSNLLDVVDLPHPDFGDYDDFESLTPMSPMEYRNPSIESGGELILNANELKSKNIYLEKGTYSFFVDAGIANTIDFTASSVVGTATTLSNNTPLDIVLSEDKKSQWYTFSGHMGGDLELSVSGSQDDYQLNVYNQLGDKLYVDKSEIGTKVYVDYPTQLFFEFVLLEQPGTTNNGFEGTVTLNSEDVSNNYTSIDTDAVNTWNKPKQTHTFTQETDGFVYIDITGNQNIRLTGAQGNVFNISGNTQKPLWLAKGAYELSFEYSKQQASYEILTAQAATLVSPEQVMTVEIPQDTRLALFTLSLDTTKNHAVNMLENTSNGGSFTLYDAYGRVVKNVSADRDSITSITANYSGDYFLLFKRNSVTDTHVLNFELKQSEKEITRELAINKENTVSFLTKAEKYNYILDVDELTFVSIEPNDNLVFNLYDIYGNFITNINADNTSETLSSGKYKLQVTANNKAVIATDYSFTPVVTNTQSAIELTEAESVEISFNNVTTPQFLELDLVAGTIYFIDVQPDNFKRRYDTVQATVYYNEQAVKDQYLGRTSYWGGNYRLIIKAENTGTYTVAFTNASSNIDTLNFALTAGDVVSEQYTLDTLAQSNTQDSTADITTYTTSVAESGEYLLASYGNNYNIIVTDINKNKVILTTYTSYRNSKILSLEKGDYEITLIKKSDGENSYGYGFKLTNVNNLQALPFDEKLEYSVDEAREPTAFIFDGVEGEEILVDVRDTTNYNYTNFYVYDVVNNTIILSGNTSYYANSDNSSKVILPQTGQYVLVTNDSSSDTAKRSSSIFIRKTTHSNSDINLGDVVNGSIAQAGDVARYTLQITQPKTIIIDQHSTSNANVKLTGPYTYTSSYSISNINANRFKTIHLKAGTYVFEVTGDNAQTPDYTFSVLDVTEQATHLDTTNSINETIVADKAMAVYSFDVQSGQDYYFNIKQPTSSNSIRYDVVSESGQLLVNQQYKSQRFTAKHTGKVYFVAKKYNKLDVALQIQADLLQPLAKDVQQLPFDGIVSGQLTTHFDSHSYHLNLMQDSFVKISDLASNDPNIRLSILRPDGSVFMNATRLDDKSDAMAQLAAGDYIIKVTTANTDTSSYNFTVSTYETEVDNGTALTAQELFLHHENKHNVNQVLEAQTSGFYRLVLAQGDTFTSSAQLPDNVTLQLLNDSDEEIAQQQGEALEVTIQKTGVYYVKLTNNIDAQQEISFDLTRVIHAYQADTDIGDTIATAKDLYIPQSGALLHTVVVGDDGYTNDVDMYRVLLTKGDILNIRSDNNSYMYQYVHLYNQQGKKVTSTQYTINRTIDQTGVYYIAFSGSQSSIDPSVEKDSTTAAIAKTSRVMISRSNFLKQNITSTVYSDYVEPESFVSSQNWSGQLNQGDIKNIYFEITESGYWYLDNLSYDYSIYDSYDHQISVIDETGRQVISGYEALAYLTVGKYQVTLHQKSSSGSINFAWRNLAEEATPISYGQAVQQDLRSAQQADVYVFEAQANDTIRFNTLGNQYNSYSADWNIYNQYGQSILTASDAENDSTAVTLLSGGLYYVVFNANTSSETKTDFQIDKLTNIDLAIVGLNQQISGNLTPALQQVDYQLSVTENKQVLFDGLNSTDSSVLVKIVDASGKQIRNVSIHDGSIFDLVKGDYTLSVYTSDTINKSYAFKLLDLADVENITSGQLIQNRLQAGEAQRYQIEVNAGDRIFVDVQQLSGSDYYSNVRIIDPYGRVEINNRIQDSEFLATVSGTYTLVFDNTSTESLAYRMAVFVYPESVTPRPISLIPENKQVDLVVSEVQIQSSNQDGVITSGSQVTISWKTSNNGVDSTFGDFKERVIIKNTATGDIIGYAIVNYAENSHGALLPQETQERSVSIRIPGGSIGSGDLTVLVETDFENTQSENSADEENNQNTADFVAVLAESPNLVVENISLEPSSGWQPGQNIQVTWQTKNTGQASAVGSWLEKIAVINESTGQVVAILERDVTDANIVINGVLDGTAQFTWPTGINAIGTFGVTVTVDILNTLAEHQKEDGGLWEADDNTAGIVVTAGPDLTVSQITIANQTIESGDSITLSWTDTNQGTMAVPIDYQHRLTVQKKKC